MSLSSVLTKLNEIADLSSSNDKVFILRTYLKETNFLRVVRYALSKDKMFHVKKLPKFKHQGLIKPNKNDLFDFLDKLSKQAGTSDSDKKKLAYLASIDKDTYEVVTRIVKKDLKCGASSRLVNKARPGTINIVPYMRCHTNKKIDNIQYPAIVQEKADGMFANLMINKKGQIKIITRNGKNVFGLRKLKKLIRKTAARKRFFADTVYTGELLVMKNGKILPRNTGNGILNSCINNTVSKSDADCVVFRCWDCLPLKNFYNGHDSEIFIQRFTKVKMFVKIINNKKSVDNVITKQVSNKNDAEDFYTYIRQNGGEGAILKNTFGEWKNHTSPDCIKLKNVEEAELKVVAINSGRSGSKYDGKLGSLICETRCGNLSVGVGSGLSDEDRELDVTTWLGKIITVEFEGVIKDKKKSKYSLFLPRFKEVRQDRDKADSLEEILNR